MRAIYLGLNMMQKYLLFTILFLLTKNGLAQSHYLLSNFYALKDNSRVILQWTIKRGSTCIGTAILRSTDNVHFEVIGEIQGICGSSDFAQSYNFTDENPVKNKTNYYILELGFSGKTEPSLPVTYFDFSGHKSKVIPNPMKELGYIYFENPNNVIHHLHIFDSHGKYVFKGKSETEYFTVSLSELESIETASFNFNTTKYYYIITDDSGVRLTSGFFLDVGN